MKTVLKNVYYCDHCKKRSLASGSMKKHEAGCTLNPNRKCRVCDMLGAAQQPIADLLKLLPDPNDFKRATDHEDWAGHVETYDLIKYDDLAAATNAVLPAFRKVVEDCPACIMAALRQRGIPVPIVTGYNWTSEMKAIWAMINEEKNSSIQCGDY